MTKVIAGIGKRKCNKGTQWHLQDRIYKGDIAMAITTCCYPWYVIDERKPKKKLCNELIRKGCVKAYDIINHSYSTNRMKRLSSAVEKENNICPTLTTRCDCLGVVVYGVCNTKNK